MLFVIVKCCTISLPSVRAPLGPAPPTSAHSAQTCCLHSGAPSGAAGETAQRNVLRHRAKLQFHFFFLDFTVSQHCAAEF